MKRFDVIGGAGLKACFGGVPEVHSTWISLYNLPHPQLATSWLPRSQHFQIRFRMHGDKGELGSKNIVNLCR
jgi:hypothetical protein